MIVWPTGALDIMPFTLRRAVGVYFLVTSLQSIPTAVFMLGVQNTFGPQWALWATPLAQGVVMALAGLWLVRSRPSADDRDETVSGAPSLETLVQLFGVYFTIEGLVSAANPLSSVLLFNEVWSASAGSRVASPVVSMALGLYLVARPSAVVAFLKGQAA